MKEFLTFHQVTFSKDNFGIKKLFGLNTFIKIGIQQSLGGFTRNPKNPNQIEIPEKINLVQSDYNKFANAEEAFEIIKCFIYDEFKLDEYDFASSTKESKELYFYVFEDLEDESPKFRGVLYATLTSMKPLYYVAFTKSLEYEYDREIYKK